MQIEPVSFFVLLIDVHLIDMFFVECVLHQLLAISFSLFIGMYKEHFNEFVAQPHKGSDFSFPVADDVKLYGLEILVSYQWLVELYVLFCQEMVGTANGGFPYGEQFVIILRGGSKDFHRILVLGLLIVITVGMNVGYRL